MLHGVSFRLLHNPPIADIQALFSRLRGDGCDAVSIIPHHYVSLQNGILSAPPSNWSPPWFIWPDLGQDPEHPFHNTPQPELVLDTARAAQALGMRVMLKPHVDWIQGGWRGFISVKPENAASMVPDWAYAYKNRFLQRYVDIAKQIPNAILCLGCELYTVSKELGPEFWIGIADWVRAQGFTGPLTYAANWGWGGDAEYRRLEKLWPHLDYIGVDAYFPLVPENYNGPLDAGTFLNGWSRKGIDADWCPRIDDDLLSLSRASGKPILFAEIGYGNYRETLPSPGADAPANAVRDDQLQATLAQAFRQKWGGVPEFGGYFWWEAWLQPPALAATSHDILDKPIEKFIFQPLPGEAATSPTFVKGPPAPDQPWAVPAPTPAPATDGQESFVKGDGKGTRDIPATPVPSGAPTPVPATPGPAATTTPAATSAPTATGTDTSGTTATPAPTTPAVTPAPTATGTTTTGGPATTPAPESVPAPVTDAEPPPILVPPPPGFDNVPDLTLPPAITTEAILARNGLHAPNCPLPQFSRVPNGPAVGADPCWDLVQTAQARWIKLLHPEHNRADAERARQLGLKVLVRAPGEGFPGVGDVQAMIREFAGVADVIEVGNEPYPTPQFPALDQMWWNHAWYLEAIWEQCNVAAHAAGIQLCTPGWQAAMAPPNSDSMNSAALADRIRTVYGRYDAIGVHCYDIFTLARPEVYDRIARWHDAFQRPVYITEYGIAARYLISGLTTPGDQPTSDIEKADRYAAFLRRLGGLPYVQAAFLFILGGTSDWASFRDGRYDPNGDSSYWLAEDAYAALGQALTAAPRDLGEEGATRDLPADTRPHGPDYPINSVSTISPAVYATVLQKHNSPALQEADALAYYRAAQDRGINPAVSLAFFEHESQCGTEGPVAAAGAKNWGNLRPRNDGSIGRAARKVQTQYGIFRGYDRFLDGLLDWCDLMNNVYKGMTIREALKIYAPSSDQNDPNSYAGIVLKRVAGWDQQSGDFTPPGTPAPTPQPGPAPTPADDTPDFALLAQPSIPLETFTGVLQAVNSPALQEGDGSTYYNLCAGNGVDPAVALAFFGQESEYGTAPGAAERKNWGNLWNPQAGALGTYDTWLEGLRDWCNRLQRPTYTAHGPATIKTIVPLYAPATAREHGPDWYIRQLAARIQRFQGNG